MSNMMDNSMKANTIIFFLFLAFSTCYGQGQIQFCKTCKQPIGWCNYLGKHPTGSKISPFDIAMKKGKEFYGKYDYASAIVYYKGLLSKFPSHSAEIKKEMDKCNKIVSFQKKYTAMTPNLAASLKKYKVVDNVGDGLVPVEKNGLCGFINLKGEIVIPCKYKHINSFSEGLAKVMNEEGQTAFVDTIGNISIPFSNGEFGRHFHEGFVGVKTKEGMGFMNKKGEISFSGKVHVYNYDCVFSEGVTSVMVRDNVYAYVNKLGEYVIKPFQAWDAKPFFQNVAPVRININGKVRAALIDKSGAVLKSFEDYFEIGSFSEGLAYMGYAHRGNSKKFKVVFVDKDGKSVLELPYHQCGNFRNGLAYFDKPVSNGWKYGYIDNSGKVVINAIYDYACDFSEGFALVNKGNKWGLVDRFGNCSISYK